MLWIWLFFVFLFLLLPLSYGWGYRGWGPPYPSYETTTVHVIPL